jgi:thymidylate kinase
MPLIILFGPDGSGKTTIAMELIKRLRKLNYRVVYIKMRSHHLLMYLILRLLQKLDIISETCSPRIIDYSLRKIFRKSKMFVLLEFSNIVTWYLFFVKPHIMRKTIVIADRFSPDSIVSLHVISKVIPYTYKKVLLSLCRKSTAIYVRANPEVLLSRKIDEDLSEKYLKYVLVLYDEIVKYMASVARDLIVLDTTNLPKDQSIKITLEYVGEHL